MPGEYGRITKNTEYQKVFQNGKKAVGRYMVIFLFSNQLNCSRYGIIASKKVGKAVARNRAKRRIRELTRRINADIPAGYDLVIVARPAILEAPFQEITAETARLLKKVGLS